MSLTQRASLPFRVFSQAILINSPSNGRFAVILHGQLSPFLRKAHF